MPKPKKTPAKRRPGAPEGNQNAAKGIDKKLVSARVVLLVAKILKAEAGRKGISLSDHVATVLTTHAMKQPAPE